MKKEITEIEYSNAIKIIIEYSEQTVKKTQDTLKLTGTTKTPKELEDDLGSYFPTMNGKLFMILKIYFENTKLCDITKRDFLNKRYAGNKSWEKFCEIIGRKE